MKLKQIALIEDTEFRSLPKNFEINFSIQEMDSIDPKCIVGLNGSGKSNLLELIAEIFFYIEIHLMYGKNMQNNKDFAFKIEYTLPPTVGNPHLSIDDSNMIGRPFDVKVEKTRNEHPKFYTKHTTGYKPVSKDFEDLLPNRIVGYSSGHNELLSNPFLKMRFHYIEQLRSKRKSEQTNDLSQSRMFWMDKSNNNAIVIANLLLGKKLGGKHIRNELGIFAVDSFEIVIDFARSERQVTLSREIYDNIERLKSCSPFWYEEKKDTESDPTKIKIIFFVTYAVIQAFKHHFGSAQKLFEVFYQLQLLNLFEVPSKLVTKVLKNDDKSLNISEEIPFDPNQQVFSLRNIKLKKFACKGREFQIVKYNNLSDGEHQFLQIHGAMMMLNQNRNLFLFDEPETHFNPMWRSKMVQMFTKIASYKENIAQDILLTTHSPFILSDSKKENVIVFKKVNNVVSYETPSIKTFGTSIDLINLHIFAKKESIANYALEKLDLLRAQIKDGTLSKSDALQLLMNFGDSFEKMLVINELKERENSNDL